MFADEDLRVETSYYQKFMLLLLNNTSELNHDRNKQPLSLHICVCIPTYILDIHNKYVPLLPTKYFCVYI